MGMHFKDNEEKITISMIIGGIIIIGILLTSLIVYLLNINSSKVNEEYSIGKESLKEYDNQDEQFEDVTSEIGKSVNEAKDNLTENNNINSSNKNVLEANDNKREVTTNESNAKEKENYKSIEKTEKSSEKEKNDNTDKKEEIEKKNEVQFLMPVKGEIIREFAPDSLVYSETLKEWITHNGVDIKADKASDVVASSDGKVESIKNDPRYGLTIIIDHKDGYRTIYANLLNAEYVVEGEEVSAGQTIGTVGNTANFEIADDYHLHFEVLKDEDYVDPLKFIVTGTGDF